MATATISFGLVSIPVKLFSTASSNAGVHFNLVHAKCGTRIKQQYYCPTDDEVVPYGDLVRGYEFAKDKYVTFTTEELDAIEAQSTQEIEITEFLPEDQVDPIYFDKSYYLGPDKGGDRAYRLLSAALHKTKRIAVAKYAARGKMYLVALLPKDGGLIMQQLHYADEVKDFAEVPRPTGTVDDAEMNLALKLIDQGAAKTFNPVAYHDEVKDRLSKLVDKKVAGENITEVETEEPRAKVVDLMQALRQSLEKKGISMPESADKKGAKRAPARKAPVKKTKKA
ncbi:MAG: Ku protein [Clostridia bacterium]|nr:Ku protein [Deltaproteobacteria bacterium]